MNKKTYENSSKEVSYVLKYVPWEYALEIDEQGRISVEQLLDALHQNNKWENLALADLLNMIDISEKKRHEIRNGKIKAFKEYSIPMKITKEKKEPPHMLYHGTAKRFLNSIAEKGLLPQKRQYIYLSQDIETALTVGKRQDEKLFILEIHALDAWIRR